MLTLLGYCSQLAIDTRPVLQQQTRHALLFDFAFHFVFSFSLHPRPQQKRPKYPRQSIRLRQARHRPECIPAVRRLWFLLEQPREQSKHRADEGPLHLARESHNGQRDEPSPSRDRRLDKVDRRQHLVETHRAKNPAGQSRQQCFESPPHAQYDPGLCLRLPVGHGDDAHGQCNLGFVLLGSEDLAGKVVVQGGGGLDITGFVKERRATGS